MSHSHHKRALLVHHPSHPALSRLSILRHKVIFEMKLYLALCVFYLISNVSTTCLNNEGNLCDIEKVERCEYYLDQHKNIKECSYKQMKNNRLVVCKRNDNRVCMMLQEANCGTFLGESDYTVKSCTRD
ncbi:hypothetical protein BJ944DRAFT_233751 [Cunninghamella echinulata]|nr:hypothetical protein BJ944DRAFT_233751 [Cunninghamella echinulata]